ncbi:MAG: segregation/condensation protein A [Chloroflexi bacterium]|nr:segregation/condensation protein A [Chloroflexota bacterium]
MINQYKIDLPAFSGPLDLLLHLIEREELDITAISLAKVTQQYLAQVEHLKENRMEQLIDFLVIAARLVLIKSRALLPQSPVVIEGEDEEDPAEALVRQLRLYKQFKQAAGWLGAREEAGLRTYLRIAPPPRLESRLDMSGITLEMLVTAVHTALARAQEREESVAIVQPRRITIEGQIRNLQNRVKTGQTVAFQELLSEQTNPVEISVTLLAVLELIKRQEIIARQPVMFGPIEITAKYRD